MSLVNQLKVKHSPVSQWMEANTDRKEISAIVKGVNDKLTSSTPLIVEDSKDLSLVGTAFDYGFRWTLGPLDANALVAMQGAQRGSSVGWVMLMPVVVRNVVERGNATPDTRIRVQCAIILAWFEQNYRNPFHMPRVLESLDPGEKWENTEPERIVENLFSWIPEGEVRDIIQLLDTVPDLWGDDLKRPFILNPTFDGSSDVGGADADWIVDGVLYDCKVSKRKRPFQRWMLLQNLGYVFLDYSGKYPVEKIGWYFARQRMRIRMPLKGLLLRVCGTENLQEIGTSFAQAVRKHTP